MNFWTTNTEIIFVLFTTSFFFFFLRYTHELYLRDLHLTSVPLLASCYHASVCHRVCVYVCVAECWQWGLRESLVTPACSATLSTADSSTETPLDHLPPHPSFRQTFHSSTHTSSNNREILSTTSFQISDNPLSISKASTATNDNKTTKKTKWNNTEKSFVVQILKQREALQRKQTVSWHLMNESVLMSQLANN